MTDLTIVGAGLAGLTLGWYAKRQGYSVKLLEASSSPGGRIFTFKDEAGSTDLGAEFIASYHTHMLSLCRELGIPLIKKPGHGDFALPERMFYRSGFLTRREIQDLASEFEGIIDELVSISENVDPVDPGGGIIARYDHLSIDRWLRSKKVSLHLSTFFTDLDPTRHSMLGLLCLIAGSGGKGLFTEAESYCVADGTGAVVRKLAQALASEICYTSDVTGVERSDTGVYVCYRDPSGHKIRHRSAAMVLAIPSSRLSCIRMDRRPPDHYTQLPMSQNRTMSISLKDEIAPDDLYILTDQSNRIIYTRPLADDPRNEIKVHVCPHLTAHKDGIVASTLRICGIDPDQCDKVVGQEWGDGRWPAGSYPFFPTGYFHRRATNPHPSPEGIFYAGDYLVPGFAGFMEGAVRSANRILERFGSPPHD